jgi:hypothetical protein
VVEAPDASQLARFYIGEGAERWEALGLSLAPGAGEMLGVRTLVGRPFLAEEYRAEAEKVALIGYALWQQRFGADPNVAGRSFQASRSNLAEPLETFRIVGVLPPDLHYARGACMSRRNNHSHRIRQYAEPQAGELSCGCPPMNNGRCAQPRKLDATPSGHAFSRSAGRWRLRCPKSSSRSRKAARVASR